MSARNRLYFEITSPLDGVVNADFKNHPEKKGFRFVIARNGLESPPALTLKVHNFGTWQESVLHFRDVLIPKR
jgi:hypothetical protein